MIETAKTQARRGRLSQKQLEEAAKIIVQMCGAEKDVEKRYSEMAKISKYFENATEKSTYGHDPYAAMYAALLSLS